MAAGTASAKVVVGAASAKVAAGAGQETSPAEMAAGAPSVEVAADAYPAEKSRPRGRWLAEYGSAPTDPEAPPIWLNTTMSDQPDTISVGRAQPHEPTEAERIAQVGATRAACEDAVAAYVDVARILLQRGEEGHHMLRRWNVILKF